MMAFPNIPIFNYHHVHDEADPSFRVTPDQLHTHISFLLEEGFQPITLAQMIQMKDGNQTADNPVFITFDDGYENFLTGAWPVMDDLNIPCTLFIISDTIGKWNDWDGLRKTKYRHLDYHQLRYLSSQGVTMGSHSRSHPMLTFLKQDRLVGELNGSKQALEQVLGVSIDVFAYPGGHVDKSVCQETSHYYKLAFATSRETGAVPGHPYRLPRIDASFCTDLSTFQNRLRGQHSTGSGFVVKDGKSN